MTSLKDKYENLLSEIDIRGDQILSHLMLPEHKARFKPLHIEQSVFSYLGRDSKRLRPALLLLACGAVGGDERSAIPAAAAVEVFHTWTLVHDDLIDDDAMRRGGLSVHEEARAKGLAELGLSTENGFKYGRDIAILVGDIQHAWAVSMLTELRNVGVDPAVVLTIIDFLESKTMTDLIHGETLDVQFGRSPTMEVTQEEIIEMLYLKTGSLYEFAGLAGALIGLNIDDISDPTVNAVRLFARAFGIAFQLQDDILGLIGDQETLGKPVGSDIIEGKQTTIVKYAFDNADQQTLSRIKTTLGNPEAKEHDIAKVIEILESLGGIAHTRDLAEGFAEKAREELSVIPDSKHKALLLDCTNFCIERFR